jgi:hypothetical protein
LTRKSQKNSAIVSFSSHLWFYCVVSN